MVGYGNTHKHTHTCSENWSEKRIQNTDNIQTLKYIIWNFFLHSRQLIFRCGSDTTYNNNNSFCRVSFQWLEGTTLSFIQMDITMQNDKNNDNGTYSTLSNTRTANITTDTYRSTDLSYLWTVTIVSYFCFFKQEMSGAFLHGESFARVFKEECQHWNVGWNRVADSPGLELDHGITIKHTSMSGKGMKDTSVIYINI